MPLDVDSVFNLRGLWRKILKRPKGATLCVRFLNLVNNLHWLGKKSFFVLGEGFRSVMNRDRMA